MIKRKNLLILISTILFFYSQGALADSSGWGLVSSNVLNYSGKITSLLFMLFYITATGFLISACMKYRQHRESPQYMPVNKPATEFMLSLVLFLLPTIFAMSSSATLKKSANNATAASESAVPGKSKSTKYLENSDDYLQNEEAEQHYDNLSNGYDDNQDHIDSGQMYDSFTFTDSYP